MKNIFLIIILFIISACSSANIKNDLNFSDDMSLEEFKIKLKVYSKNSPYPNIDN